MRYVRYLFLVAIGFCLLIVALANRAPVPIKLLPDEMAAYVGQPLEQNVPLFIVIFASIVVGLLIGFVWEWLREHGIRAEAARTAREKRRLEREVKRLKGEKHEGKDEVLALLEEAS